MARLISGEEHWREERLHRQARYHLRRGWGARRAVTRHAPLGHQLDIDEVLAEIAAAQAAQQGGTTTEEGGPRAASSDE